MGAALSIVVLFTVTSTIVRVAGVVLEHSGIPRHIARLQAISALMGTGFTTSESELILQTPERRKILIVLMFTGGIGFGSLIATVVVGAFGVSGTTTGLLSQVAAAVAGAAVRPRIARRPSRRPVAPAARPRQTAPSRFP